MLQLRENSAIILGESLRRRKVGALPDPGPIGRLRFWAVAICYGRAGGANVFDGCDMPWGLFGRLRYAAGGWAGGASVCDGCDMPWGGRRGGSIFVSPRPGPASPGLDTWPAAGVPG